MLAGLFLLLWLDSVIQFRTMDPSRLPNGLQGLGLLVLLIVMAPLAINELAVLFTAEHVRPYRVIATAGSSAMAIHAFLTQFAFFRVIAASAFAFIIVFVMILAAFRRALDKKTDEAIHRMAGTVLATLYLGGMAWFLMAIRVKQSEHFVGSTGMVLMILVVVKSTDIGAFFGGRALGRRKMIPWLSPKKTWEGLICGLITSGIVGAIFSQFLYRMVIPWWKGFIISMVLGAVGQAGDLLESLMKRDAEVKDSGRLIPGFGGVLDVIDSPLLAAPFAYLMFSFFTHSAP